MIILLRVIAFNTLKLLVWRQEEHLARKKMSDEMLLWLLWPPYVIGGAIIFLSCGFFFLSIFFFPRLISAVADWMSTIL